MMTMTISMMTFHVFVKKQRKGTYPINATPQQPAPLSVLLPHYNRKTRSILLIYLAQV